MKLRSNFCVVYARPDGDALTLSMEAQSESVEGDTIDGLVEGHLDVIDAVHEIIAARIPSPVPGDPPVVAAGPGGHDVEVDLTQQHEMAREPEPDPNANAVVGGEVVAPDDPRHPANA